MRRRAFLGGTMGVGVMGLAAAAGLLKASRVIASEWPRKAFDAENAADAVSAYFGDVQAEASESLQLKAPLQAENGAVVPVKVTTGDIKADSIVLVVDKNPSPFATALEVNGAGGYYSARLKMGESSLVTCYVKSGDKVYQVSQQIKVTVGGCGG